MTCNFFFWSRYNDYLYAAKPGIVHVQVQLQYKITEDFSANFLKSDRIDFDAERLKQTHARKNMDIHITI